MFWFMLMLSPTNSQIHTPSFSINCPSLVSTARSLIILWRLCSHKPSHKNDSNKYQSNAFVICDHKSDETRSVTHENKAYLVWLIFRMLSNQHYPHRANQKLRPWANAVFQKRGVCGQAVPSFPSPSPSPVILFPRLARKRLLRRLIYIVQNVHENFSKTSLLGCVSKQPKRSDRPWWKFRAFRISRRTIL